MTVPSSADLRYLLPGLVRPHIDQDQRCAPDFAGVPPSLSRSSGRWHHLVL